MLFPRTARESPTKTTELGTTLIRVFSHRRSQGNAELAKHALMWAVTSGGAALSTGRHHPKDSVLGLGGPQMRGKSACAQKGTSKGESLFPSVTMTCLPRPSSVKLDRGDLVHCDTFSPTPKD